MSLNKNVYLLLLIIILATVLNITKAVHIDDTAYLEVANQLVKNPLHPMTGIINWYGYSMPMYKLYHPFLLPIFLAPLLAVFGQAEIIFHLEMAVFTGLSTVFFYFIVKKFQRRLALWLTAGFILSPAFLPSQNLMPDVPLATFFLGFFFCLFCRERFKNEIHLYLFAGLFIGLATLTKYAGFILFPIMVIDMLLRKKMELLWTMLLPLAIIAAWSGYNLVDYGKIHIFGSQATPLDIWGIVNRFELWLMVQGAVFFFTPVFFPGLISKKSGFVLLALPIFIGVAGSQLGWTYGQEPGTNHNLREIFLVNGLLTLAVSVYLAVKMAKKPDSVVLILWLGVVSVFMAVFVPFMAVRHLLLVLPALMLLFAANIKTKLEEKIFLVVTILSICLGGILAVSDYIYADTYRRAAREISGYIKTEGRGSRIWFTGQWGWQWYAKKAGFVQYDQLDPQLSAGDYLVMPKAESKPVNPKDYTRLELLKTVKFPGNIFTKVRLMTNWPWSPAGFYAVGDPRHLPWTISDDPLEEFTFYKVGK